MTKKEFLSGAKFRHLTNTSYIYQYGPGSTPGFPGFLWQVVHPSGIKTCVATLNEINEESAAIDLVVLGQYQVLKFVYSDFETC